MYYSMNGTGSIGEAVLIDSQNPTAGSYDPVTHQPVNTTAKPSLVDQFFNTANKAIDAFNPQLKQPTQQPVQAASPSWVRPVLIVGIAGAIGYGIYRYVKSQNKK